MAVNIFSQQKNTRTVRYQTNLDQARSRVVPPPLGSAMRAYDMTADGAIIYPGFAAAEYMNFGYWEVGTNTRRQASDNLMRRLLAQIPERRGRVLDVACGLGFTTQYLRDAWSSPADVYATNISERQLRACKRNAPACAVAMMDATHLGFADGAFTHIVCVEAAFHFDTRLEFLREAARLLKPGGTLVLTDLLLHDEAQDLLPDWLPANHVPTLDAYHHTIRRAGFSTVDITDITSQGVTSYLRFMFGKVHDDWLNGLCDFARLDAALSLLYRVAVTHRYNIMCVAQT